MVYKQEVMKFQRAYFPATETQTIIDLQYRMFYKEKQTSKNNGNVCN